MKPRTFWIALGVLAFFWSCRDGTSPSRQGIIVLTTPTSDTIQARPLQALTVQVRGSGAAGVVVRFENLRAGGGPFVRLASLVSNQFVNFVAPTADGQGKASVLVEMGFVAGDADVVVSVPELGLSDTVGFTVRPGAASRVLFNVRDTVVLLGGSYPLTVNLADRFGNPRPETAPLSNATPSLCALSTGRVTGVAMGRCVFTASHAVGQDTARATVLPSFRIATHVPGGLRLASANGGDVKTLYETFHTSLAPAWAPDGSRLLMYEGSPDNDAVLSIIDTTGVRTVLAGGGTLMHLAYFGRFSPDGQWVYFSGRLTCCELTQIWRVRPNGTDLDTVVASTPAFAFGAAHRVSVSPDGQTLAFDADRRLALASVATGEVTPLNIMGVAPTISPDGQKIAFIGPSENGLFVANIDGTNVRAISTAFHYEWQPPQWISDGKWLLITSNGLKLTNVETGESLPLVFAAFNIQGSIKPPVGR